LSLIPHDPTSDDAILARLAWACDPYSPVVGIEETEHPECLLLDITGCADLFHGEDQLACQLQQQVEQWGLHARIAIAGTIGMAWALAHTAASRRMVILSPEDEPQGLQNLPIHSLRLSTDIVDKLKRLGIHTAGQVLDLPRKTLPSRFGNELTLRLDQARGLRSESITPQRRPDPIDAKWESEHPLRDENGIDVILSELLRTLLDRLHTRGEGIQHLIVSLNDAGRQSERLTLELLRPTTEIDHLLALLRLQWERIRFRDGLIRIHVECNNAAVIPTRQPCLTGDETLIETDRHFEQLIERLSSRLGRDAVLTPGLIAEAQPERSYSFVPYVESGGVTGSESKVSQKSLPARPLWIMPSPQPVDVLSTVSAGPPYWIRWQGSEYVIAHSWGPERITTGWWNGEHVRRDYYVVEAECGRRFWLFRDLSDGCWFLHAEFD
ncbi:MAG: DNA polymerase Y family protein, partial [Planctomycetaceae bacterium]|nr:DNA polymerase Y family protein [Planctomycetaceae bacterium]